MGVALQRKRKPPHDPGESEHASKSRGLCVAGGQKKKKRSHNYYPGGSGYEHTYARMELDSHADTCALGKVCLVVGDAGRTVDVGGFAESIGSQEDVKIVHAAVAYECPKTFKTYVLIFHKVLHLPDMEVHLLNPKQMRCQDIIVNEVPLQDLQPGQRTKHSHSIISEDPDLHIPLSLKGTMSGFNVRAPTWDEVNDDDKAIKVHMTSHAVWEPHNKSFQQMEEALQAAMDRDFHLPRRIGLAQARGQNCGQWDNIVFESDVTRMHPSGCDDPEDGVVPDDTEDDKDPRFYTIKALHQQQQESYLNVLDFTNMLKL